MPSKRKRPAAGGERQSEEREESPAPNLQKRRKKLHYEPTEICQELYETIRNHKSEEGRLLCEAFIRVPKRRTAADYYDVVATPIDLLKIQQKIKTDEYDDIDLMTSDIELMLNNAKSYYKKSSQEYKDACDLLELFHDTKSDLLADAFGEEPVRPERRRSLRQSMHDVEEDMEENPENSNDSMITDEKDDPEDIEQLFAAVMSSKDGDRDISLVFHLLPQKSKYPEYYQIIKNPIDMKMIAQKIKDGLYNTFDDIEKDFSLMVKNAKTFNEPKSQIYKDAVTVKKIVQTKKQELQQKKTMVPKPPERVRTRNLQKMSTICAALKYPSDDEEDLDTSQDANSSQLEYDDDSGAETVMSEEDNSHWSLLNAVKQYRIPSGETIYEPFNKLPSRRFYPDYYEEIAKPMSLSHIRKKMKFNQYRSLEDVASDLNLVFENAKQYNADESILYQHAVLLQKAMWERKKELEKIDGKDFSLEEMSSSQFDIPVTKISRELFDEDSQTSSSSRNRRSGGSDSDRKRAKRATPEEMMKRRLWTLYKSVYDYTDSDSRPLRYIFMQLPSKRDYPDYYQVIAQPIDLSMIEAKLRSDKYPSEQHLIADFELLFNNARHYNEEESVVYQDADQLEKVLKTKWKQICHHIESRRAALSKRYLRLKAKSQTQLPAKLQEMYDAVSCYQDVKGRTLSTPFLKLPLKTEYPDYYEVIKKPIDMQRIVMKMQQSQYECVEDMTADFVQMFDNACKYNEPDSLIYKDALTLQRLVLEKKMELTDDGTNDVPEVKAFVQEMMTSLFISTYNHQDEEGRCYSDSFAELPERDPDEDLATSKEKEKPLSFDQIKKNLDKGRYVRMDRFQEDMFKVFERARKLSRTDSQLYEDAVEMQIYFIRNRDEICKNGEILLTPALSYQEKHFFAALEEQKQEKQNQEQKEDEEKRSKRDSEERMLDNSCSSEGSEDSFKYKEQTFHVGDFVYIEPREKGLEPHIMCVEKMFVDNNDIQTLHGNWYYRPNETFHLATRKFLEKEVFKSDFYTSIPLTQVLGKCYVMYVKDYFKSKPQEFDHKDVYVCESRYNNRHKCFKKIKIWQVPGNDHVTIVPRDIPLVPVRVASVFADKKEEDLDDGETGLLDKERANVPVDNPNAEDGCSYFEQLQTPYGTYKIGDCLYLKSNAEFPLICKIEKIWIVCGESYFTGTGFVRPADIPHSPTRLFYRHELFLSSLEAVYPMSRILKKCSVLHIKEYVMGRITDILEEDTYLCESKYQETDRIVKKLGKGFKKHGLSPLVTDDEIYFFKKPITPQKMSSFHQEVQGRNFEISQRTRFSTEPSPLLLKAADDTSFLDDSQDSNLDPMDDSVLSFDTDGQLADYRPIKKNFEDFTPIPDRSTKKNTEEFTPISEKPAKKKGEDSTPNTERPPKKAKSSMKRQISGYIVYSGEIRKLIQQENPDCTFGEISRIVGGKWRNLCKEEKEKYEEKAKKIAEEQQAKQQEAEKAFNESLQNRSQSPWDYGGGGRMSPGTSNRPATPGSMHNGMHPMTPIQRMGNMSPMRPYMPPYQPGTPGMRPMMSLGPVPAGAYPGTPQGQQPNQSSLTPQNSMSVLPPHPGMSSGPYPSSKSPGPQQGSMGGTFSGMPTSSHASMPSNISMPGQQMAPPPPPPPPRPPSPMFVSVPPRTQRLLHSEAYLRYIEGLNSEKQTISDWDKILTATPENTQTDESRLPTHWLAEGAGYHGNVTNALWALRDLMLKDTMNISRTLPFEAL